MYSVVLMMAMTSGGDVQAGLFGGGCGGGGGHMHSCGGGHGCRGGHMHSCGGGHGFCGGRGHSCGGGWGGCCGMTASCGCRGGHGFCGGKHQRSCGCCGNYAGCCGYNVGCGCYGGYGGYGAGIGGYGAGIGGGYGAPLMGAPVVPNVPANVPANTVPGKKTSIESAAPAKLVISLPADATLTIDGVATTSTTAERVFVSPALEAGREFHYTLQAEFVKDGKSVKVSKEVAVKAGSETRVSLDSENANSVASR